MEEQSGGYIVQPTYIKYSKHVFNVYRQQDLHKFIKKVDEEGGLILSVVKSFYPNTLSSGFDITYSLDATKKPIEMEILC